MLRRTFDIVFSASGLIMGFPVFLFIAAIICLDSPGGPLFFQERVGYRGRPFMIWKFRTLYVGTGSGHPKGFVLDLSDDRVTRVGRILRYLHADEFPQFWNILRGDMSIFGWRPMTLEAVEEGETEISNYREPFFYFRPGLFSPAAKVPEYKRTGGIHERFHIDMWYVKNRTWLVDLRVLLAVFNLAKMPGEDENTPALELADQN